MPRSAVLNIRIEPEIKAGVEELFGSFGLTVTDAVNVFLRQSLMCGGFPFEIVRSSPDTVAKVAIREAESLIGNIPKTFTGIDESNPSKLK